ncbi:aldo/keto reductase [Streptomyces sp. HNM0574]|uniref:aldo/keto reductase n=1 Tax=Streptomyces sp. HNM0574 TaxID=2714954 RepID=UPI00146BDF31|nr:aldo/keto reductase [Streptomyces sp. HNM0574]NLU68440.1 aldo/keto reductase [Streptomyces sp. HNM0574]
MPDHTPDHAPGKRTGLHRRHRIGSLSVAPLNLGGNVFGWTADEATSFDVLDAYTAAGGNFLDTADVYSAWIEGNSGGESETVIGDWMAARGNRDDIVVATKAGAHPQHQGLAPATLRAAVEDSLRRLRTDRIDLFYTHYDDESIEVSEIIGTLDELVREGKLREIAASNISPARLRASLDFSAETGSARYVALQPHYNLVEREAYEGELSGIAERENLAVMPYFALAAGFLTGKYRAGQDATGARAGKAAPYLETERGRSVLRALEAVALAHDAEPATIALAWLAARPTVTAPVASARHLGQLPTLLAMADTELLDEELELLTEASV